jgi:hypothetical protein
MSSMQTIAMYIGMYITPLKPYTLAGFVLFLRLFTQPGLISLFVPR